MNPLEAMAKAIFMQEFEVSDANNQIWERLTKRSPAMLQKQIAEARAGLLALSECELPEEIAQEGGIAGHVMDSIAVDCFRAMLRAIANVPLS